MMKELIKMYWVGLAIAVVLAIAVALTITAFSEPSQEDLNGTWEGQSEVSDVSFTAVVEDNLVQVDMDLGGLRGLYWLGDVKYSDGSFVSEADQEKLDNSMVGSGSDTKTFNFEDGSLEFDFQIMGMSQTIEMEKQ